MAIFKNEDLIDGRFRVQYLIKENRYCETYKVRDENDVSFFLKLYIWDKMPNELTDDENRIRPIVLITGLSHPNILNILHSGSFSIEGL